MHKIMVVDDEVIISSQLERRLSMMGYDVVGRANSGEKSVDMARSLRPDLILMDIVMPGRFDGIEAARRIREDMNIPVIFMTAYADDHFVSRAKQVEPFGYILKPFQEKEVRAAIEVALHKIEVERDLHRSIHRLKSAVDCFHHAIVTVDRTGKVMLWSRKARELFGWDDPAGFGSKVSQLVAEPCRARFFEHFIGAFDRVKSGAENEWMCGFSGVGKDGKEFPIEFILVVHMNHNEQFATFIVREGCGNRPAATMEKTFGIPALDRIIPICSYCRMVRDEEGVWHILDDYLIRFTGLKFSHSICPICLHALHPDMGEGKN